MKRCFDLEQLYFQAKEAYYQGEPIMEDDEFDSLEQELLSLGSTAPYVVGSEDRKAKYSHPSPMLSLAKYQALLNGTPPTQQAETWMNKIGKVSFEVSPKYMGTQQTPFTKKVSCCKSCLEATVPKGATLQKRFFTTYHRLSRFWVPWKYAEKWLSRSLLSTRSTLSTRTLGTTWRVFLTVMRTQNR